MINALKEISGRDVSEKNRRSVPNVVLAQYYTVDDAHIYNTAVHKNKTIKLKLVPLLGSNGDVLDTT